MPQMPLRESARSYQLDFSKPFAVQWGETQLPEEPRNDAFDMEDQRIANWLSQKLPPLYADAIDIAAAVHCADRLSLRGSKKRGWGRISGLRFRFDAYLFGNPLLSGTHFLKLCNS